MKKEELAELLRETIKSVAESDKQLKLIYGEELSGCTTRQEVCLLKDKIKQELGLGLMDDFPGTFEIELIFQMQRILQDEEV